MTADVDCVEGNRALQTALELSMLNLTNATYSTGSPDPPFSMFDNSLISGSPKKSQNITQCVAVPSSEHVAEIVGRQGTVGGLLTKGSLGRRGQLCECGAY